ncbi:MAG TPA: SURF1 family protein [Gemmatimonadaceae bacterium]|nr:SURF1 family protein [Gemmatimonadaceae bacterium]
MRRSPVLFAAIAVVFALVCIRLGVWQLSRLQQRRAANAVVAARLDSAVTTPAQLPADTALARFRRVRLRGTYDYDHEIVLAGRSHDGSPGVNLLTPLRLPGRDTAVLVNRGWVYSPDALRVDAAHWREPADAVVTGFVETFHDPATGAALVSGQGRTLRWLDAGTIGSLLPYPVASYYVIASAAAPADTTRASADGADVPPMPARLDPPALDEGSHLSYAIQWFAFAAIALAGTGVFWWSARRGRRVAHAPPAPPLPQ